MLRLLLRELGSLAPQLTKHSRRLFLIKTLSKTFNSWPCAVILEVWKCITVSKPSMSPNVSTFSIEGMVACTLLSALDHNANRERQHAIASKGASQGELQGKIVLPKHTEEWVATPILQKTNRDHLSPVLVAIIIARQNQKP